MPSVQRVILLILLATMGILLFWKYELGVTRYFDIDEFAHLHWTYNFFSGMHPYRDYLYFFPPGFLFLLWPLFAVMGKTYAVLTAARILAFGSFLLLLLAVFLLVRELRGSPIAWLTLVILAWLPLPADKFLEIRPDTPAMALTVLGMYLLVQVVRHPESEKRRTKDSVGILNSVGILLRQPADQNDKNRLFLSGLCYGFGLMIVPKMVLFAGVAIAVLLFRSSRDLRKTGAFFLGLSVPAVITGAFFLWSGDFARAVYLTTAFASESTKVLGSKFYMFPSHFFYPNDVYYGQGGSNTILVSNHLIYMLGLIAGAVSAASLLFSIKKREKISELIVSASFLINLYAFMRIIPLKHAQYLILLAPFVAFYCAVVIMNVLHYLLSSRLSRDRNERKLLSDAGPDFVKTTTGRQASMTKKFIGISIVTLLCGWLLYTNWQMYSIKRRWTNRQTFAELQTVAGTIPEDAYVWDLFGETLFYKDPYYICCIPYGQYQEAFGFTLPSLSSALERTGTQYIFAHNTGRLSVLPAQDAVYVSEHYRPIVEQPLILGRK